MLKELILISLIIFMISCNNSSENSDTEDTVSKMNDREVSVLPDSDIYESDTTEISSDETITEKVRRKEWTEQLVVFIFDTDNLPTNVRKEPKGEIILKLPKTGDYEVWLKGEQNGWFWVDEIQEINENIIHENVNGYIHGSILAAATTNYGDEKYHLYKEANENSEVIFTLNQESMVFLLSSNEKGNWIKVRFEKEGKTYEGWIRADKLCGNTRTNCS